MTILANLFANASVAQPEELLQTLLAALHVHIERIVSWGHASPPGFWYDQHQHEWVLLVQGAARLRFEDDATVVEMRPGSYLNIPAHRRHRVDWTDPAQPTVWLAVHYDGESLDTNAVAT